MNTDLTHTIIKLVENDYILDSASSFFQAKMVEGVSPFTLTFYRQQIKHFLAWIDAQAITRLGELTPGVVRQFLLFHGETHNAGGCHAVYRSLRVLFNWIESESDETWRSPLRKIKPPRVELPPLEPAKTEGVLAMLATCRRGAFLDDRDRAAILFLVDSGCRAREMLAVEILDVEPNGAVLLRKTKSKKTRTVFLGSLARKALRVYLRHRIDGNASPALWVTKSGAALTYGGLRALVTRRAALAGVEAPGLHSFRRLFALESLRAGIDAFSLQSILGHSDMQIVRRYLAQTTGDLATAHAKFAPGDRLLK